MLYPEKWKPQVNSTFIDPIQGVKIKTWTLKHLFNSRKEAEKLDRAKESG
jgi:hypothetical protein